jgi:hypothetical protein
MYTRDDKGTAGKPRDTRQVNNATTLQAKNAYRGPGGVPLLILTLGTRRRRVVSFKQSLFTLGEKKSPTQPLNKRLVSNETSRVFQARNSNEMTNSRNLRL